ncbi:MAG: hypothetical protein LC126_00760 [Bryobacterales bacterium]|nr:hypothetical protein [Bryobacterales bacterium]
MSALLITGGALIDVLEVAFLEITTNPIGRLRTGQSASGAARKETR